MVASLNIMTFENSIGTKLTMLKFRLDCGVEILFKCRVYNSAGIAFKCIVDDNISIVLNCSFVNGTGIAPAYGNNMCLWMISKYCIDNFPGMVFKCKILCGA